MRARLLVSKCSFKYENKHIKKEQSSARDMFYFCLEEICRTVSDVVDSLFLIFFSFFLCFLVKPFQNRILQSTYALSGLPSFFNVCNDNFFFFQFEQLALYMALFTYCLHLPRFLILFLSGVVVYIYIYIVLLLRLRSPPKKYAVAVISFEMLSFVGFPFSFSNFSKIISF